MEFEEMQMIWNEQNQQKLFAIDEAALHKVIRRKSKSSSRWLGFVEWLMIALNPLIAIVLVVDAVSESGPTYQFVIAAMYAAYAGYGLFRRLRYRGRQDAQIHNCE